MPSQIPAAARHSSTGSVSRRLLSRLLTAAPTPRLIRNENSMMANESEVLSHAARNSRNQDTSRPKVTTPVTQLSSSATRSGTRATDGSAATVSFASDIAALRDNHSARSATLRFVAETSTAAPKRPRDGSSSSATSRDPTAAPSVLAA